MSQRQMQPEQVLGFDTAVRDAVADAVVAGVNVTVTQQPDGTIVISATGGGAGNAEDTEIMTIMGAY